MYEVRFIVQNTGIKHVTSRNMKTRSLGKVMTTNFKNKNLPAKAKLREKRTYIAICTALSHFGAATLRPSRQKFPRFSGNPVVL
jgi:hypothetical protein